MSMPRFLALLLLIVSTSFVPVAFAESVPGSSSEIGKIILALGEVNATAVDGTERALKRREVVREGDTISTGVRSRVLMRLNDGSKFELGAEASLKLAEFVYKDSVEEDKVYAEALKGVFRFVTGRVAKVKPESMKVKTAVATIGVRGTHVLGEIKDDGSATVILLEQEEGDERKTAIDVTNNAGSVHVDEPGWGTYIADANTAPTPARRMRVQTIQNIMRSMQSIQRIPTVRPRF